MKLINWLIPSNAFNDTGIINFGHGPNASLYDAIYVLGKCATGIYKMIEVDRDKAGVHFTYDTPDK